LKKRILTITPFLWSGAGKAIVRLVKELKVRGLECELISSGDSRGMSDWPEYVRQLKRAEVPYHTIDFFARDSALMWQGIQQLGKLLQETRFDLLHVHAGEPAFAAVAAMDLAKKQIPIVATFHSWNPDRPEWMNHADVWALNQCDHVVANSESYLRILLQWGLDATKSQTIHLGVDCPPLATRPKRREQRRRKFRILSVGRIEPRKDQETLLRAFASFHDKFPASELWIAGPPGDDAYFRKLKRRAIQYGWDEGVRWLGKVADPGQLFYAADLYVTASRDEGLGLALLEAMSYGLPTLCTPVPGHLDFAEDDRNTRFFPLGDYQKLCVALCELHGDPSLRARLGRCARQTVRRRFSWRKTVASYLKVYRRLWS
jgi:glycosyltransferase involved in cell wall biosynthesis